MTGALFSDGAFFIMIKTIKVKAFVKNQQPVVLLYNLRILHKSKNIIKCKNYLP
jgi:hypothetical protein